MILTHEDYKKGKEIVDNSIKENNLKEFLLFNIEKFKQDNGFSSLEERNKLFLFIQHISTLYLNYCLNGHEYLMSDNEIEKCHKSREILGEIVLDLRGIKKNTQNESVGVDNSLYGFFKKLLGAFKNRKF